MTHQGICKCGVPIPYVNIQDTDLIFTVPADALAPNGLVPSVGTVLATQAWFVLLSESETIIDW